MHDHKQHSKDFRSIIVENSAPPTSERYNLTQTMRFFTQGHDLDNTYQNQGHRSSGFLYLSK